MDNPEWTLYRSFLAVAEEGSLSAAARVLGLSQPTLGRHIAALEAVLATTLFTRGTHGLAVTDAGMDMMPAAMQMREAAATLDLLAAGRSDTERGTVRLTASRVVSHFLLPPILADLRRKEPRIDIELVPSDSSENLLFREADIALRMYRPTQLNVVTRHLCDLPTAIYAAKSYLDRVGRPTSQQDLLNLDIIGFDRSDLVLRLMASLGVPRRREDFPVRCDDQVVYWNLVRAGCGIGAGQCAIGDAEPLVERVPFIDLPALPVWLTAPEALRQNPRIRKVLNHLAAAFKHLGRAV